MLSRRILLVLLAFAVALPAWVLRGRLNRAAPAAAIAGRFATQDSGLTVLDRLTGLHWQQGFSGSTMDWADAKTWCTNNTPGLPGSGWRLPTVRELFSLADVQTNSPAIDPIFAGTPSEYFWTVTPWVSGGGAWRVDFSSGYSDNNVTSSTFRVRCVR